MHRPSYETLFRLAPAASLLLDPRAHILDANEASLTLLGKPLERLQGASLEALRLPGSEEGAAEGRVRASFQRASASGRVDTIFVPPHWCLQHVPVLDPQGNLAAVLQTVTRMDPAEPDEMLDHGHAEAGDHVQRLQSVGRLSGGIAHAFNNLLQVIGGNLQLLRRTLGEDPVAARRLEAALEGVERGGRLAAQLIGYSSRGSGEPGPVHLGERVEDMLELLSAVLGQGVDVRLEVSPALWPVLTDAAELEDVLLELASCARQALQGSGHLSLRLDNRRLEEARQAGGEGDYVVLTLTNGGAGVRELPPSFHGHGAQVARTEPEGLAVIKRRIRELGGFVQSEFGVSGFSLQLFLPQAPRLDAQASSTPGGDSPDQGAVERMAGSLRVLFIEDDPTLRMLTGEVMTELGHDVTLGESAEDALVQLGEQSFDVLFTDIGLPGMDGLELARQVRARYPGLEVVIASGYMVDAAAEQLEGVHCVLKPYDIERIRLLLDGLATRHPG